MTRDKGEIYGADYFDAGIEKGLSCYENYRWRPELTVPMVREMIDTLGIDRDDTILDFGCAKGYVVKAFWQLCFTRVCGIDISEYAIENADPEIRDFVAQGDASVLPTEMFDWIIAKDVLEHMDEEELRASVCEFRSALKSNGKVFVVVPLGFADHFVIPAMHEDVTHQLAKSLAWWCAVFEANGFEIESSSTEFGGVMKQRWRSEYPDGHGFIVARKGWA